jgi:hypothetical protein
MVRASADGRGFSGRAKPITVSEAPARQAASIKPFE